MCEAALTVFGKENSIRTIKIYSLASKQQFESVVHGDKDFVELSQLETWGASK